MISVIAVSAIFRVSRTITICFAVRLRWFPVAGWEGISTAVLPSLALSAGVMATVAKVYSSRNDRSIKFRLHIISKERNSSSVLFGHALRNALIPIITIIVLMLAGF